MELSYLNFLDLSTVPPIVRMINYKYIKLIGKAQTGERLSLDEWKKVIRNCNASLSAQIAISACAIRDKKEGSPVEDEEFLIDFHGKGLNDLAAMMIEIQEKQYPKINIDANILSEKLENAYRNRERYERFFYLLALIRCVSHESNITVKLAAGTDEKTKEKIMNAGADLIY